MSYIRSTLQIELNKLIGNSITDIYYFDQDYYEANLSEVNVSDFFREDSFGAVLIKTADGISASITNSNYESSYELGGLHVQCNSTGILENSSPNHSEELIWKNHLHSPIVHFEIIENTYHTSNKDILIPFGIKLIFENKEILLICCLSVETYSSDSNTIEFIKNSGSLVMFFKLNEITMKILNSETSFFI